MYKFINSIDGESPVKVKLRGYVDWKGDFIVEASGAGSRTVSLLMISREDGRLYRLNTIHGCPFPRDSEGRILEGGL